MIVVTVLAAVGGLVLVAMAYAVGRLQGEVKRLHRDLEVAQVEPTASGATPSTREFLPPESAVAPAGDPAVESIPVITAMVVPVDEPDLSVSRVASVTLARPLIKVAAFSYGVRRALGDENRFRIRYAMRQEFKRQRKMRRRRAGRGPMTLYPVRRERRGGGSE
jgi:hypothetical protein